MKSLLYAMFGVLTTGAAFISSTASAALNDSLSPVGAILAANEDGTIPRWTGGITKIPEGYTPGKQHPDPFADDKIITVISQRNLDQYKHMLSEGTIALFVNNANYNINVYPSRRSVSLPERIYESSIKNASTAELTYRGHGVSGVTAGIPFPVPQNGQEAIWNHTMRYRGEALNYTGNRTIVQPDGSYTLARLERTLLFNYGVEGIASETLGNTLFFYKHKILAPVRNTGTALLVKETIDQITSPRKAWQYTPGQRKVRRLPKLAYDDVMPDTGGMLTADTVDMFNGSLDRYDWELQGRKEFYVPYNSYKLHSGDVRYDDILKPKSLNPDLLRFEPHRVWVVDATLRTGLQHPYAKRRFYIDEDSWQILMVDIYDEAGKLIKYQEAHPINYYEIPLFTSTAEVIYDLNHGRYFVDGLNNQEDEYNFNPQVKKRDFTASALRREGRR
ncbi:DUF1329 domain-containing protein [Sansalvadorimonas verongulae]|uniref:DUF1329 domain-containing protein n=1 Tax=Sansalvadorimonas verongulae TaxID=2172824 RepID=UPI0012BC5F9F|nr:DUF1329 domain-containing protein [Sansalvadorimonas verongulae]MTI13486.1 DUF1329 domain-containing protein [Sansalvadorimonas verongulae]